MATTDNAERSRSRIERCVTLFKAYRAYSLEWTGLDEKEVWKVRFPMEEYILLAEKNMKSDLWSPLLEKAGGILFATLLVSHYMHECEKTSLGRLHMNDGLAVAYAATRTNTTASIMKAIKLVTTFTRINPRAAAGEVEKSVEEILKALRDAFGSLFIESRNAAHFDIVMELVLNIVYNVAAKPLSLTIAQSDIDEEEARARRASFLVDVEQVMSQLKRSLRWKAVIEYHERERMAVSQQLQKVSRVVEL